jgi:hypothetical protein
MEGVFNELSAMQPAENKRKAMEWMETLLNSCRDANVLCTKPLRLRVSYEFRQTQIAENYTIENWLSDKTVKKRWTSLLLALIDSPRIGKKIQEEKYIFTKNFEYKEDDTILAQGNDLGLGIAYLTGEQEKDSLAISFNSHPRWDKTEVSLLHFTNGAVEPQEVKVKHASNTSHVKVHKVWILKSNEFDWSKWQPSVDNLLPRVDLSNKLIEGDWEKFRNELRHLQSQEKNAIIEKLAKNVAEINGYSYNQRLSTHNQKRQKGLRSIYEAGVGKQKMYLSTDFETGAFEVCNHKGWHLGEYSFGGEQTKEADNSGQHNILI